MFFALSLAVAAPLLPVQGTLSDAMGAPLNGSSLVVFRIHTAETSGTLVHQETLAVSFADGAFSAALGSVTPLNTAQIGDGGLWLSVEPSGSPASARVPVGWAARAIYAERAGDAATVGGKSLTDLVEWTEIGDLGAQYLARSGGSLTGALSGTSASFTGALSSNGASLGAVSGSSGSFSGHVTASSAAFTSSAKVGADNATCDASKAGTIRYDASGFAGCNGVAWVLFGTALGTSSNPATSCNQIKQQNPSSADGSYWLRPAGVTNAFQAYCDMTTDGGGYTYYPITGGTSTCRFDAANSCTALGMNLAIPRSKAHFKAMVARYGSAYFAVLPGVYSTASGNYTNCAMKSGGCGNWRALDNGAWWVRDSSFTEPNGDYTAGCWLGITAGGYTITEATLESGQGFNDGNCAYCATSYICSTNDK